MEEQFKEPATIELKKLMCIPADATDTDIKKRFKRIAEILKNNCVIQYESKEYRILDFEFYFYNKNHQDITVHPRNSKALCWYINDFGGIDLNFESNIAIEETDYKIAKGEKIKTFRYQLTNDSCYGGILIRQIQRLSDLAVFDGPWKVAELFRVLDATSKSQNNPILAISTTPLKKIEFKNEKRHNLLGNPKGAVTDEEKIKAKVTKNIKEWFTENSHLNSDVLEDRLKTLNDSVEYRYVYCK